MYMISDANKCNQNRLYGLWRHHGPPRHNIEEFSRLPALGLVITYAGIAG